MLDADPAPASSTELDAEWFADIYVQMLEDGRARVRRGRRRARPIPTNHPLLFHCTAGKDRTGLMAMLAARARSACRTTTSLDDYELTTHYRSAERLAACCGRSSRRPASTSRPFRRSSPPRRRVMAATIAAAPPRARLGRGLPHGPGGLSPADARPPAGERCSTMLVEALDRPGFRPTVLPTCPGSDRAPFDGLPFDAACAYASRLPCRAASSLSTFVPTASDAPRCTAFRPAQRPGVSSLPSRTAARERYSFANLDEALPLPDLIAIQRESFNWFLHQGLARDLPRHQPDQGLHRDAAARAGVRSRRRGPAPAAEVLGRGVQGEGHDLLRADLRARPLHERHHRRDQGADRLHGGLPDDDGQGHVRDQRHRARRRVAARAQPRRHLPAGRAVPPPQPRQAPARHRHDPPVPR